MDDPRELPAYSISEAARYLILPTATIRYWSVGRKNHAPLIKVPEHSPTLLSFLNLVELHVLAAIQRKHKVKMSHVRKALEYLMVSKPQLINKRHPLISRTPETDGLDLFIEQYGQLVNISRKGQTAMRDAVNAALHRIERDLDGVPTKFYPFTRTMTDDAPAMIVIDSRLSAGRPVIADTGLATQIIAERYKAGESIDDLAQDYEREHAEIEEAVRCELQAAA